MKIKLEQQDPKFFHPSPTGKQIDMLKAIQKVLGWEYPKPLDQITLKEAKSIIDRGMKSAKKKGVNLLLEHQNGEEPEIKEANKELQTITND